MAYKSKFTGKQIDDYLDSIGGLATVATSGSYNDLTNKPTIPSVVTESTVSGWGFTKNTGTVTGVKVNGTTKSPTSGTVDIGNVVTSIKINGSTKTPSSGVVDLGTISSVEFVKRKRSIRRSQSWNIRYDFHSYAQHLPCMGWDWWVDPYSWR